MLKRAMGGLLLAASLTVGAAPAAQAQDVLSTWFFTGNCIDCAEFADKSAYPVTAKLLLKNYSQQQGGSPLTLANFVSFTYPETNLIPGGFSVAPNDVWSFSGDLFATIQRFSLTWDGANRSGYFIMPFESVTATAVVDDEDLSPVAFVPETWGTCNLTGVDEVCFPRGIRTAQDFGNEGKFTLETSTVPEPSTYALMAMGLVAIGFVSRKRRA